MDVYDSEYGHSLDEYWELVDGNIRMITGGSRAHAQIGENIARVFGNTLLNHECNIYSSDIVVQLNERRCYCPDVTVACDPVDWAHTKTLEVPKVVVEVLSPATEMIDKTEKLEAYQRYPAIQEILLVDSLRHDVEHYHRIPPYGWGFSVYRNENDVVKLASLETILTIHEIYFKVYLELEEI
jgi:Uma2 family endonuclease